MPDSIFSIVYLEDSLTPIAVFIDLNWPVDEPENELLPLAVGVYKTLSNTVLPFPQLALGEFTLLKSTTTLGIDSKEFRIPSLS